MHGPQSAFQQLPLQLSAGFIVRGAFYVGGNEKLMRATKIF